MSTRKPILEHQGYSHTDKFGRKRGIWVVEVHRCPSDPQKYSFAYSDSGGICTFEEFEGGTNNYLSGQFDTPELALEAGLKLGAQERKSRRRR